MSNEIRDLMLRAFLTLTTAQREALGMSEATLIELEVQLRRDYEERQEKRTR